MGNVNGALSHYTRTPLALCNIAKTMFKGAW